MSINGVEIIVGMGAIAFVVGLLVKPLVRLICDTLEGFNIKLLEEHKAIQDARLKMLIDGLIRAAETELDGEPGEAKKQWVIKRVQGLIPNAYMSDSDVSYAIEAVFSTIKAEIHKHDDPAKH